MEFKKITSLLAACIALTATASNYITQGNGTTYTLQSLSEIEGSNVVANPDGGYTLSDTITIAKGDTLRFENVVDALCGDAFILDIQGDAYFTGVTNEDGSNMTKLTRYANADDTFTQPYEIRIENDSASVNFKNINFWGLGIRVMYAKAVNISNCRFFDNNGSNAGAVMITGSDNNVNITDCEFSNNKKAAIASAANSYSNISITNSFFDGNSTNNGNTPQINVTAGPNIVISGNEVKGDSTLNNVGGIAVGNLMMAEGDFNITVENNNVYNNRYGITFTGPMSGVIKGNTIKNNTYAANAMTGGSGISLYYTGSSNTVKLRDNDIEDNLWGITLLGNSYYGGNNIDMGKADDYGNNTIKGNANNGTVYALYNNQADSVWAIGNNWLDAATDDSTEIAKVIFDKSDDASLGVVVFMPAKSTNGINAASVANGNIGNGVTEVYDLNGRRLNGSLQALPHGLYIIKKDGKTFKRSL